MNKKNLNNKNAKKEETLVQNQFRMLESHKTKLAKKLNKKGYGGKFSKALRDYLVDSFQLNE